MIKWILTTFEIWFGLKVNFYKSHVIFLDEYDIHMMVIENIMGCVRGEFPFTSLGIPLRKTTFKRRNGEI